MPALQLIPTTTNPDASSSAYDDSLHGSDSSESEVSNERPDSV